MKGTVQPLKGRRALVTGASSGIGEAVARRLAAAGAAVLRRNNHVIPRHPKFTGGVSTGPPKSYEENTMMKQIEIHGQRVEIYSLDEGRTWSSNPQSIVAYGQRKELLRLELQNSLARIDEMRDLDPDNFSELDTPKTSPRQRRKNHAHSTVDKVQLARLGPGRTR